MFFCVGVTHLLMHVNLHRYNYSCDDYKTAKVCVHPVLLCFQLVVSAPITMTVFLRANTSINIVNANYFPMSLFYSLIRFNSNAILELSMIVSRLAIIYKQRDFNFYPAWAYSIPAVILKIPFSFVDAFQWTGLTYYVIGYNSE